MVATVFWATMAMGQPVGDVGTTGVETGHHGMAPVDASTAPSLAEGLGLSPRRGAGATRSVLSGVGSDGGAATALAFDSEPPPPLRFYGEAMSMRP